MTFSSLEILIVPLVAGFLAQAIKLLTDGIKGNFDFKHLWASYGGMPSSHAAFVVALVTEVWFREGIGSSSFAIATIFALLVMRDALGLRMHLGHQGKAINELITKYYPEAKDAIPPLEERLGHTPAQIAVGALLGLCVAFTIHYIL